MDHLGVNRFLFMGLCIGGPFGLKLMERALRNGQGSPATAPMPWLACAPFRLKPLWRAQACSTRRWRQLAAQ